MDSKLLTGMAFFILVGVLYLQRPSVNSNSSTASSKPLPSIVKAEAQATVASKPLPNIVKPESERKIIASSRPLPTIVKSGENRLSPSEVFVIDSNTIRARGRIVRLAGFDAPEIAGRARCPRERELAERASAQLLNLVRGGGLELRMVPCACPLGTEGTPACNFGRACGYLLAHGRDVGSTLIAQGLAKPFQCVAQSCPPQSTWC